MREVNLPTFMCDYCGRKSFKRSSIRNHERWCQCQLCALRDYHRQSALSVCAVYGPMWKGTRTGAKRILRTPPEGCKHRTGPNEDRLLKELPAHMSWFMALVSQKALPAPKIVKYHMSCDVGNLLRQHPKPSKRLDGWFTDDDGRPMDGFAAWHKLQQARLEGKTGLPSRGCDNFDPITGRCLGHGG